MEEIALIDLLSEWFALFAAETGILGEIRQYQEMGIFLLGILAVLLCFLGIRSYHFAVALWMYIVVILFSCFLFRDKMNWGAVVTFFSITGFVMAFLAYQWKLTGAVLTAALIAGVFAVLAGMPLPGVILCILLGGVAAIRFPVPGVCLSTSVFGGVILSELVSVKGRMPILVSVFFMISGLALQAFLVRKAGLLGREGIKKS